MAAMLVLHPQGKARIDSDDGEFADESEEQEAKWRRPTDTMRRRIKAFLASKEMTQTEFLRRIG